MSIPPFRDNGWLPEGHHPASWDEIIERLGGGIGTPRGVLQDKLLRWRDALRERQITGKLILNGSFVSAKPTPGDLDGIFVYDEGIEERLKVDAEARRLIDYETCRKEGLGDILAFPSETVQKYPAMCRLDAFDFDKSGVPKGVIEVQI
jgi:hypothetical protein